MTTYTASVAVIAGQHSLEDLKDILGVAVGTVGPLVRFRQITALERVPDVVSLGVLVEADDEDEDELMSALRLLSVALDERGVELAGPPWLVKPHGG